jgi:hypothetical protein
MDAGMLRGRSGRNPRGDRIGGSLACGIVRRRQRSGCGLHRRQRLRLHLTDPAACWRLVRPGAVFRPSAIAAGRLCADRSRRRIA